MSEQPKPYNFEQAQEEAAAMQDKIGSGEVKDYKEDEEKIEQDKKENGPKIETVEKELSPEVIEKIMEKIQDINETGIAYTRINYQRDGEFSSYGKFIGSKEDLEGILKNGLLGTTSKNYSSERWYSEDYRKKLWKKGIKSYKKADIFFNIVGVATQQEGFSKEDKRKKIIDSYYARNGAIFLTFDLSHYKPIDPSYAPYSPFPEEIKKNLNRTYRYSHPDRYGFDEKKFKKYKKYLPDKDTAKKYWNIHKNEFISAGHEQFDKGKYHIFLPPISTEYGFILSYRVPPRFFKGLVVEIEREPKKEELSEQYSRAYHYEATISDHKVFLEKVSELIKVMKEINKDKLDRLIPVYDVKGNLHWPKRMEYEQVKKFVEERDKNKNESLNPSQPPFTESEE